MNPIALLENVGSSISTGHPRKPLSGVEEGLARAAKRKRNGRKTSGKNYILDTNVLLHDPYSINRFADNHVWIPVDVLSELDRFKNEQTERGANARSVHRFLSRCFHQNSKLVMHGAKTPEGGTIRIAINEFLTAQKMTKE